MTQPLILAIDQGGQSSRVAVYTKTGEQLYCFSAACATTHTFVDGIEHIEQNPQEILCGIKDCLQKIKAVLGDEIKNIVAAGFAGQGSSLLCWNNKTDETLSPVLSWQDIRGDQRLKKLPLTHLQAQQLTGLRVSPHYGASKIRWCLDNNIEVKNAYAKKSLSIGPIVSYIFWHLTGNSFVDPGHAQRTLLWNLERNDWDKSLLDLFNIPRDILPECKFHNSAFGSLRLNEYKIPFTASARDQGASLFARGLPDKNACYINIGTGAFIQRVTENLHAPDGLLVSPLWIPEHKDISVVALASPTCYASELTDDFADIKSDLYMHQKKSLYAWEATVNGAASAIGFLQQQTGLQIIPEEISAALELDPIHDCFFMNAVGGVSAPYWRTDLISGFSANLTIQEKILAWLESVIFQIVINVNLMNQLGVADKIYISGGLSNADALCQKIADLTNISIYRGDNADATLQGIACMAAEIPDAWQASSVEDIFSPQKNPNLSKRFEVWQNAMRNWLTL